MRIVLSGLFFGSVLYACGLTMLNWRSWMIGVAALISLHVIWPAASSQDSSRDA